MVEKITYEDVLEYQHLFSIAPSFILERMAKKNSNLVVRFKSTIESSLDTLTDDQRTKLHVILDSSVEDLQSIMNEAYLKTNKKQYEILANPEYGKFIELNLDELRKMI